MRDSQELTGLKELAVSSDEIARQTFFSPIRTFGTSAIGTVSERMKET